jgi:hypothetical protein
MLVLKGLGTKELTLISLGEILVIIPSPLNAFSGLHCVKPSVRVTSKVKELNEIKLHLFI